ncbi:asparagine--tRNA ligase [Buchnera aphidicola (Kurisakia onigurumii)]|uniref:asparagine--tRNA ligase n=1 Tax=Buchnera aphidicola TaxID=9 RepID=UPI0031B6CFA6
MILVSISDIHNNCIKINSQIKINGWIKSKRDSKIGLSFIHVSDGSHIFDLQVIAKKNLKNYFSEILKLSTGCSICINGKLIFSTGKKQKYELLADKIKIFGWIKNNNTYPISPKKHTLEYLRDVSHLRSRTNIISSISRIRNSVLHSMHNFLFEKKYFWIPTPIITSIDAEGSGSMFTISSKKNISTKKNIQKDYNSKYFFSKKVFLSVSGQLTLETYSSSLSKVYTFGPIFRAENSNTSRHLSEFWMLEVETSFHILQDIIIFSENLLKNIFSYVLKINEEEIFFLSNYLKTDLKNRLLSFIKNGFIIIEYKEAIKILNKFYNFSNKKIIFGHNLSSDQEKYLSEKYFKSVIVIINYPKDLKAFYMKLNKDKKTVAAMDVLFPYVGEIIGGSEREDRLFKLDQRMLEMQLKKEDYWWYRDLRKYGTVPHAGFGIGFERLLMYITGINNIRDVTPFPRTVNNANF